MSESNSHAYHVIARRWRPRRFSELVGQEHILQTLRNAIQQNRIAHAFLFVGPRGTGKTTLARLFSAALNALPAPTADFDPEEPRSRAILRGEHLDVLEIDSASNNSVEQIRDLREQCAYAPAECRFKIYILDEIHMLSTAAFNALLKTIEEPPAHVKFIFATTEPQKIPMTILSRCQRFNFKPLSAEQIGGKLQQIAQHEGIRIDSKALSILAQMAQGGMRDGQSILDQMITFCGKNISEADVLKIYSLPSQNALESLANALLEKDSAAAMQQVDTWISSGIDLNQTLQQLQQTLKKRLFALAAPSREKMAQFLHLLDTLSAYEKPLQFALDEEITFRIALLKAIEDSRQRPIEQLLSALS